MTAALHPVLIVNDDAGLQSVLRTLLEANGYHVVSAHHQGHQEARGDRPIEWLPVLTIIIVLTTGWRKESGFP
jgi:hypothetical protein